MEAIATDRDGVPASQAERAYLALRDMLVTLEIRPGAPVVEGELTARIGVGRTPLREAIRRLESERLVTVYPRRGTFASEIELADLSLLTDVREELEGHAAARAAERATAGERSELEALVGELDPDGPVDRLTQDALVHRAVYRAAHNPFLEETATVYHNLSTRIWHLYRDRIPDLGAHIEEHRELLDAIVAGDARRARSAAVAHVRNFARAVGRLL